MSVTFSYHGAMCVEIVRGDGFRILVDPYIDGNGLTNTASADYQDVDLILTTHHAFDHLGDAAKIMRGASAELLSASDVWLQLKKQYPEMADRLKKTIYGDEKRYGSTVVRTVRAFHVSRSEVAGVPVYGTPLGFVIQVEPGVTYYHTGDTCLYSDMKLLRELYHPELMCVGISRIQADSSCEMTPREAAIAVAWVGAQVVIPTHYAPGSRALAEFTGHLASFAPDTVIKAAVDRSFVYEPARIYDN